MAAADGRLEIRQLVKIDGRDFLPEQATGDDVEAVMAGWSSWWRHGNVADLAAMERRLARRLIESDRRLAALATAARMSGPHS